MSDNGAGVADYGSNSPFRLGKHTLFEGGVRVPGLMRWPDGASSGTVVDVAVSTMDIFPTTLGIVERTLAGEGGRKNRLYDSRECLSETL